MKRRLATAAATLAATAAALIGGPFQAGAAQSAAPGGPTGAAGAARAADESGGPPVLADGFGLSQVTNPLLNSPGVPAQTATEFTITVTSAQVANDPGTAGHDIRIVLPSDYYANPAKSYPTLYLLDGSPGDPCDYFDWPQFNALKNSSGMIIVMPDSGTRGWYSNWLDQGTAAGAQNWETYLVDQVIPFVDADLRTIPDKQDRAIAGVSMGGFGAMHLAQDNPSLFSQVATLSGDVDLGSDAMDLRLAAVDSLTDATGAIAALGSASGSLSSTGRFSACQAPADPYSPSVSSDALFGSPYPISWTWPYNDSLWDAADPVEHASAFAGMNVSIYVGDGQGDPTGAEFWLQSAAQHLDSALTSAGQNPYFADYGNGAGWGQCDGNHDWMCWDQDLADLLPRLQRAFAAGAANAGASSNANTTADTTADTNASTGTNTTADTSVKR